MAVLGAEQVVERDLGVVELVAEFLHDAGDQGAGPVAGDQRSGDALAGKDAYGVRGDVVCQRGVRRVVAEGGLSE